MLLTMTLLVYGFGQPVYAMTDAEHQAIARTMLTHHIRLGYDRLLDKSKVLQAKIAMLCKQPSSANKKTADHAFFDVIEAFGRVEHLRFGPMIEQNRKDRIMFWPDRKSLGLKQIKRTIKAQDPSVLSLKSLQTKSVALQGLTALEYILFSKGADSLLGAEKAGQYRCQYALTISKNIAKMSYEMVEGWATGSPFSTVFLNPLPNSDIYMSSKETTRELFLSMLTGLKLVKDFKLKAPLGKSLEKARPWNAAFWRSGQSFKMMAANLKAVKEMLTKGGFGKLADSAEPGITDTIIFELDMVVKRLEAINKPVKQMVTDKVERAKLEALFPALGNIYDNAGRYIAKATDMTAGFNALDGD